MRRVVSVAFLLVISFANCARPVQSGALIDRYSRAECVPVTFGPGITPPTRAWDYNLRVAEGTDVHISGAALPGGRITVTYTSNGKQDIAADAGDYIYPADARVDRPGARLYVKAKGAPAAFGGPQTWLFEYDLRRRRQTDRWLVDPTVLPPECPETK